MGKALGGASGGFTTGRFEIVDTLRYFSISLLVLFRFFRRQKSRPYLFSNTVAPSIVGGTLKALDLIKKRLDIL